MKYPAFAAKHGRLRLQASCGQFSVQTMQQWGIVLPRYGDDGARGRADDEDESGPYAVHTLSDDETIARLATGVKRFTLPDEFNFIRIYQQLTQDESGFADPSLQQLAQIYEDRQRYPKAAQQWQESIRRFRDRNRHKRQRLEQIVGNWGRFEGIEVQPARTGAGYRLPISERESGFVHRTPHQGR
ncbi:MAG: hypothetical protein R3B91_18435 [Planctomycetaceae bacterium]